VGIKSSDTFESASDSAGGFPASAMEVDSAVAASDMNRGEEATTLLCLQMGAGANALALPARRIAVADNKKRILDDIVIYLYSLLSYILLGIELKAEIQKIVDFEEHLTLFVFNVEVPRFGSDSGSKFLIILIP